jgi:hypothetical protein
MTARKHLRKGSYKLRNLWVDDIRSNLATIFLESSLLLEGGCGDGAITNKGLVRMEWRDSEWL